MVFSLSFTSGYVANEVTEENITPKLPERNVHFILRQTWQLFNLFLRNQSSICIDSVACGLS